MALSIVHGPPNSGRAGVVRRRFTEAIGRDPILVVPTLDDVFSFSRELCPAGGALLGGSVTTFDGLFRAVGEATEVSIPPPLTKAQRLALFAAATERTRPRLLRASSRRPGFPPALEELVTELQAAEISPGHLADGGADLGGSALLAEVASLYRAYEEMRDAALRSDPHAAAAATIAALTRDSEAWRARPVLIYGFDDLTAQQLSLLQTLAPITELTAAVTYEDREALAARSDLLARLRDTTARDASRDVSTEPQPANTASPLLYALERGFLADAAAKGAPDGSLRLLRCAGDRAEAEMVGGEVARLLAAGAEPASIAIAVRDPRSRGPLLGRVLSHYGIPVAVEADLALSGTATGVALSGLLRAAEPDGAAADLLAYLRAPGRAIGASVDALESWVRRRAVTSSTDAAARWEAMGGGGLSPLAELRAAGSDRRAVLSVAAETALDLSQWPIKRERRQGAQAEPDEALELRAGAAIAAALGELSELEACRPEPADLPGLIEGMTMPLWSGPATGRVRISSPYRLRAARFAHVFVVSLQDGEFPSHRSGGPFLSDEQRGAAGLSARADTEAEERYLFHACLSLPTDRLYLSHRYCDDEGTTLAPSPYLDDVRALLTPELPAEGPDPLGGLWETRALSDVVFAPGDAPSSAELARALAAGGEAGPPEALGLSAPSANRMRARLTEAAGYDAAPGPLHDPSVIAALAEGRAYGGTTLEEYATCSYRWFVNHELDPQRLDPDPEPLAHGGAVHGALEELYKEPPAQGTRPSEVTLPTWIERGSELLEVHLGKRSPGAAAGMRIGRRRLHGLLEDYLRRDARRTDPFETAVLEGGFGLGRDAADPGALSFGDWELHGSIDRIDVDPVRRLALVHDYKVGTTVTQQDNFGKKKRLQLALYLRAVRDLWHREPVAGLYHPLARGARAVPRGMGLKAERDEGLATLGLHDRDWVSEETFEARIEAAEELAGEIVTDMRAGRITRDPLDDTCPRFCTFAPICRIDRRAESRTEPSSREAGEGKEG